MWMEVLVDLLSMSIGKFGDRICPEKTGLERGCFDSATKSFPALEVSSLPYFKAYRPVPLNPPSCRETDVWRRESEVEIMSPREKQG